MNKNPVDPEKQKQSDNTPIFMEDAPNSMPPPAETGGKNTLRLFLVVGALLVCFLLAFNWLMSAGQSFQSLVAIVTPKPNWTETQAAWIKPAEMPILASAKEAGDAWDIELYHFLNYSAMSRSSPIPDVKLPGVTYIYELNHVKSEPLFLFNRWCAINQIILEENLSHIQFEVTINEVIVPLSIFVVRSSIRDERACRLFFVLVKHWPPGVHHLESRITFSQPTDDGWNVHPTGTYIDKYIVIVEN